MSEATCPRCNESLACGWWCARCKLTLDRAASLKQFEKVMNASLTDYIPLLVIFGLALTFFAIAICMRG